MPKAYIIHRRWISYWRYITRSKRNGYHWKKSPLSADKSDFFRGAGYGSRTRLHGLGSRCITDIRTLRCECIIPNPFVEFKSFLPDRRQQCPAYQIPIYRCEWIDAMRHEWMLTHHEFSLRSMNWIAQNPMPRRANHDEVNSCVIDANHAEGNSLFIAPTER